MFDILMNLSIDLSFITIVEFKLFQETHIFIQQIRRNF